MISCRFELNNKHMSTFWYGTRPFPAFSGIGEHRNRRLSVCIVNKGPTPPGTYYIFDRQTGELLGAFYDMFNDHSNWFALYAIDGKIDDETYCKEVKRGAFRLHPKGDLGISRGCITIESQTDYQFLRTLLRSSAPQVVPDSKLKACGKVVVR